MEILVDKIPSLSQLVTNSMESNKVMGCGIGLIKAGKQHDIKYYNVDENTHFEAASLTKPVFAYFLMSLYEGGILDFSRPLDEYSNIPLPSDDEAFKKVTAKHILTHGTGLPDWGDAPLPLAFNPGKEFQYSGKGYTYLQKVVEQLIGDRIDIILQREIFNPLEMNDAAMIWTGPLNKTLSRTYDREGNVEPLRSSCKHSVGIEPNVAFTLYVTIGDYIKFLVDLLGNQKRLNLIKSYRNPAPYDVEWGLGWGLWKELLWHWGDNGGFKSFVILDPRTKDAVLVMTNSFNGLNLCYDVVRHLTGLDLVHVARMVAEAE